jgi:FlaG/FlaF family flagellin (archaellin)
MTEIKQIFIQEDAVSSTIGVVLMLAVTVILAAAVGTFALGLAEENTKKTPSASVETGWGVNGGADTLDIKILGGDTVKAEYVTIENETAIIWDESGPRGSFTTYDGRTWSNANIQSGDTLGLRETMADGFQSGDTIQVIWDDGERSQVLGAGTMD